MIGDAAPNADARLIVPPQAKMNARRSRAFIAIHVRLGELPGVICYDVVGAGFKCRYIIYALIDPVLANSFQKISEVRICRRYPFSQTFRAKNFQSESVCVANRDYCEYNIEILRPPRLDKKGFSAA
jgi:hypothetical protein